MLIAIGQRRRAHVVFPVKTMCFISMAELSSAGRCRVVVSDLILYVPDREGVTSWLAHVETRCSCIRACSDNGMHSDYDRLEVFQMGVRGKVCGQCQRRTPHAEGRALLGKVPIS